jgi:hypothetical protein
MRYAGVGDISELVKRANDELYSRGYLEEDFENVYDWEFVNHFQILEDTVETIKPYISSADPSVGIMSAYLEEAGASIVGRTYMSKESATELLLTHPSFDSYLQGEGLAQLNAGDDISEIKHILKKETLSQLGPHNEPDDDYRPFGRGRRNSYPDGSEFSEDVEEMLKTNFNVSLKGVTEADRTIYIEILFAF